MIKTNWVEPFCLYAYVLLPANKNMYKDKLTILKQYVIIVGSYQYNITKWSKI